ncbi:DUF3899 domain-containing protein [Bacillus massiliglaciei]|uniref:DUF3899 domain-containing protein n=1 Tax=Bacillus massiliglaciei TaxID=1816693 RepID=UPI000DA63299|nr:DUF3899 domain-containing protein [Bacillus massiliglaciei]
MKWKAALFFITMLSWYLAAWAAPFSKADLSDTAFLTGLLLIIIAGIAVIIKTGFLSLVTEGFKIIGERMIRKSNAMERADSQMKSDYKVQTFKASAAAFITQISFIAGIGSLIVSVINIF